MQHYCVAETWQLYPGHCPTPMISPADLTVLTASDILRTLGTVPTTARDALDLGTAIRDLQAIIAPTLLGIAPEPRVTSNATAPLPQPRVLPVATAPARNARVLCATASNSPAPAVLYPRSRGTMTTVDVTFRNRIRGTGFVHQRVTRNNNPFAPLADNNHTNDPTDCPRPTAMPTTLPSQPAIEPLLPTNPLHVQCHAELSLPHPSPHPLAPSDLQSATPP
jgi:hypothetical protein